MGDRDIDALLAANDERLRPLILASSDEDRRASLEAVLTGVLPVVRRVLAQRQHTSSVLHVQDTEDIASSVTVRLVARLQRVPFERSEAIERLTDFAAASTFNALHDFIRRQFPARAQLKERLRHAVNHDARFRLWPAPGGSVCGLLEWPEGFNTGLVPATFPQHDPAHPADAVASLLRAAGEPLLFDEVVQALAEAWQIVDEHPGAGAEIADAGVSQVVQLETRSRLEALWQETCALPAPQRAALLLNLRDGDGGNAIALFALLGVASLNEVAAAIQLPLPTLASLWPRLPLDDLAIAALLGVKRQQVINLRLAARQRLARRLKKSGV